MAFEEEVKGLFDEFLKGFPSCSLIFLSSSEGFPLWAEGEEARGEEFSAYFSSLNSLIQRVLHELHLGDLRSAVLVSEGGFCSILPVNASLSLGVVFKSRGSSSALFSNLRSLADEVRRLAEKYGL